MKIKKAESQMYVERERERERERGISSERKNGVMGLFIKENIKNKICLYKSYLE